MTLVLAHITSLDRAINIVTEKRFRPTYDSPLAADSGLNAHIKTPDNEYPLICYERTGATLLLEWDGPVTQDFNLPLPVNTLVDQRPFRVMVSHGTNRYLRAVGIELDDSTLLDRAPPFYHRSEKSRERWKTNYIAKRRKRFNKLISKLVKDKPLIQVLP